MKRLLLFPIVALALAACSESPISPVALPDQPLFDVLEHPSGLAFANGGADTGCVEVHEGGEWRCDYHIVGAAGRTIDVWNYVKFEWTYRCVAKSAKNTTSGTYDQWLTQTNLGISNGNLPIIGNTVHTPTTPTVNPCGRKGKPTLQWTSRTFAYWEVSAENEANWEEMICKRSDGLCE